MRRSNLASLAVCEMFLLFPASSAFAQFSSSSSSSSSSGSSHSSAGGSASYSASVNHYTTPTGTMAPPTGSVHPPTGSIHPPTGTNSGSAVHHPHSSSGDAAYIPYYYSYAVPYTDDQENGEPSTPDDSAEYQGGPTIFDRRGSGSDSYIPPAPNSPNHAAQSMDSEDASAAQSDVEQGPIPTELVFKDGHQLEVDNYAIVNQTLFDLTPGHVRKVSLSDLDLAATEKQNDDRGVMFQLPPTSQAN